MQSEVTLILTDEHGRSRKVPVRSGRFTIGRGADNDLVVDDAGLSRRHVVIETYNGIVQISDCGSANGTFLNGIPISTTAVLADGDVISMGSLPDVRVELARQDGAAQESNSPRLVGRNVGQVNKQSSDGLQWLSPPIIATAAIVMILIAAGALLWMSRRDGSGSSTNPAERAGQVDAQPQDRSETPAVLPRDQNRKPGVCGEMSVERVEKEAVEVMVRSTSDRQRYEFPPSALADIKQTIERYCKSGDVPIALRSIAQQKSDIRADVNRRGQGIEPYLVTYAVLGQADGVQKGTDYAAAGRQMLPVLVAVRIHFGTDADSTLIALAAYTMGPGTKKSHPLLAVIRRIVESNPSAKRNVWYLHERNGISTEAYQFVIRFLALGIIAQNPREFGIEGEPFAF
jgi:FHA domain-containing protein